MPQVPKIYPPKFIEKILEAKRARVSNDQIRADFMLTEHGLFTIMNKAIASGQYTRPKQEKKQPKLRQRIDMDTKVKILQLKNRGLTSQQIATTVGINKNRVVNFVSKAIKNGTYTSKKKPVSTPTVVLTEKEIQAQQFRARIEAQQTVDELRIKRQDTTLIRKYQGFKLFSTKGFWLFQN